MKKFKVIASSISYFTIEIEAEDDLQAWQLAKETDGGEFEPDGDGDWEIYSVEEVKQ